MDTPNRIIIFATVVGVLLLVCAPIPVLAAVEQAPGRTMAQQAVKEKELWITSDHTKHEILKQKFAAGEEVTEACLTCHTEAGNQVQQTIHWTWMDPNASEESKLGKGGLSINNF